MFQHVSALWSLTFGCRSTIWRIWESQAGRGLFKATSSSLKIFWMMPNMPKAPNIWHRNALCREGEDPLHPTHVVADVAGRIGMASRARCVWEILRRAVGCWKNEFQAGNLQTSLVFFPGGFEMKDRVFQLCSPFALMHHFWEQVPDSAWRITFGINQILVKATSDKFNSLVGYKKWLIVSSCRESQTFCPILHTEYTRRVHP